jgi:hypothetical protein
VLLRSIIQFYVWDSLRTARLNRGRFITCRLLFCLEILIIALLLSNNKRCGFDDKEIACGADIFIVPSGSAGFYNFSTSFS